MSSVYDYRMSLCSLCLSVYFLWRDMQINRPHIVGAGGMHSQRHSSGAISTVPGLNALRTDAFYEVFFENDFDAGRYANNIIQVLKSQPYH